MSERPSHEPQIQATQRLSPQSTLFEALSCLLTQGLSCVPVGDAEPAASFLSARTLLQAWHDGLPGETPISGWRSTRPRACPTRRSAPTP
jgi:hypothetical protein